MGSASFGEIQDATGRLQFNSSPMTSVLEKIDTL